MPLNAPGVTCFLLSSNVFKEWFRVLGVVVVVFFSLGYCCSAGMVAVFCELIWHVISKALEFPVHRHMAWVIQ